MIRLVLQEPFRALFYAPFYATDLTLDSEQIMTLPSGDWKRGGLPDIDRRPTVFLLQA